MYKLILAIALMVATFNTNAQGVSINTQYVGKKCPDCTNLQKWEYETVRHIEVFTNPDTRAQIILNWSKMTVTAGGKDYHFTFSSGDKTQTVRWCDEECTVVQFYYDKQADFIGLEFLQ